ncbi:MAG: BTAD domain-containing putative transcriptional regulator [SAR324 cluster bacterium]
MGKVWARTGLFKQLDAARRFPIVWLSSPAGSGKTALVSSYLEARRLESLWYQLDEGDSDPATFFHYLGLAALQANRRRRRPFPIFGPEYRFGSAVFARRFFEQVCSRIPAGSVIVLDNYQQVAADSPLHGLLNAGLSAIPAGISVLVLSRTDPPESFASLRAGNRLTLIAWLDLKLSAADTRALIRLHLGRHGQRAPVRLAGDLHRRTQGWAAGVTLMIEQIRQRGVVALPETAPAPELVFAYFGQELFAAQPEEFRQFLIRTAIPPVITLDLAQRLTGHPQAEGVLQYFLRNNLFTSLRPGNPPTFQYHDLFREFLLAEGRKSLGPEALAGLQRTAARHMADMGASEDAVTLLLDAQDWEGATRSIAALAPDLVRQGRFQTLLDWLSRLPDPVAAGQPWLRYWRGAALLPRDPPQARDAFEAAYGEFLERNDAAGCYLSFVGVVEAHNLLMDDFHPLQRWLGELQRLQARHPQFPSADIEVQVVRAVIRLMWTVDTLNPELPRWIERATRIVLTGPNPIHRMLTANAFALPGLLQSKFGETRGVMEELDRLAAAPEVPVLMRILSRSMHALRHHLALDGAAALRAADEGLALGREYGVHVQDGFIRLWATLAALLEADVPRARQYLGQAAAVASPNRRYISAVVHFMDACIALYVGELPRAEAEIGLAISLGDASGNRSSTMMARIVGSSIHAAQGSFRAAARDLRPVALDARKAPSRWLWVGWLLARADLAASRNRRPLAVVLLRKALRDWRKYHYYLAGFNPGHLARLCALALEEGIEADFVRELIAKCHLAPPGNAPAPQDWPWPVRVYALGAFRIVKDGTPLSVKGSGQRRPLELLRVLIALGGREVAEARIADALWPDSEGDAAHTAFNTTLHRLRSLLGAAALPLTQGALSLDGRRCWTDCGALEELLRLAEGAGHAQRREEAARLMTRALALWPEELGRSDADLPLIAEHRRSLREALVRRVFSAAADWLAEGDPALASPVLEACLRLDPTHAGLCDATMKCQLALDRAAAALHAYDTHRLALAGTGGGKPSPAVEATYRATLSREGRRGCS